MKHHPLDLRLDQPPISETHSNSGYIKSWNSQTKFLLFANKAAMPGGGWHDLKAITVNRRNAMQILLQLNDHPFVVNLVDINTFHSDLLFKELYEKILVEHRNQYRIVGKDRKGIIIISDFENIIMEKLSLLD